MSRETKPKRLIDKVLEISRQERLKQPFAKIQTREDLLKHMPLLVRLLNSDPELGLLFLADPLKFLEEMEIQISDEVRAHLAETLPTAMQPNDQAYQLINQGKAYLGPIESLSFELPPTILERLPRYQPTILPQKDDSGLSFMDRMKLWGIDQQLERVRVVPRTATPPLSADTGGWDIAVEFHESLLRDLWFQIFMYQYFSAALLKMISGVEESELVEPWHEIYTWFLIYFHVKITFNTSLLPEISLDTANPDWAKLILKFNVQILGRVNTTEDWSEIWNCSATAEIIAGFKKVSVGYFAGQTLKNYHALNLTNRVSTVVRTTGETEDALLSALIKVAIDDYLRTEIPELPLTPPLPESPPPEIPFIGFNRSQVNAIDLSSHSDALAISWSPEPLQIQSNFIKGGNNFALGISSAVMHYLIRSKLHATPFWKDDTEITQIDAELHNGHIRIYGNGTYHTGACWPNVNFSYSVNVILYIDNDGKLASKYESDPQIDVDLPAVVKILAILLRSATLVDLDGLIDSIATTIAGKQVEDSISEDLDFSEYIKQMFSSTFGPMSLSAHIPEVEVNRNGVFFHGNLEFLTK